MQIDTPFSLNMSDLQGQWNKISPGDNLAGWGNSPNDPRPFARQKKMLSLLLKVIKTSE
jgi:hypothetical protein